MVTAEALRAAKAAARREARTAREAAAAAAPDAAAEVAARFLAEIPLPEAPIVSGYSAIGAELDPLPLMTALAERGARLALPVVAAKGAPLQFRAWALDEPLVAGVFGARIPASGAALRPDILLVPLLAFDRAGMRLGYGGGFYDRTLAALRAEGAALAVGLAYAAQERASVPVEPTDQRLDGIVTERETFRI